MPGPSIITRLGRSLIPQDLGRGAETVHAREPFPEQAATAPVVQPNTAAYTAYRVNRGLQFPARPLKDPSIGSRSLEGSDTLDQLITVIANRGDRLRSLARQHFGNVNATHQDRVNGLIALEQGLEGLRRSPSDFHSKEYIAFALDESATSSAVKLARSSVPARDNRRQDVEAAIKEAFPHWREAASDAKPAAPPVIEQPPGRDAVPGAPSWRISGSPPENIVSPPFQGADRLNQVTNLLSSATNLLNTVMRFFGAFQMR